MVFRDDFSDGSLSQWQVARGSSAHWKVKDEVLVGMVPTQSSISELIPAVTAWSQRWGNYRFTVDMKPMRGVDRNLGWNYQDPRNWYEAHFVGNLVELYRLRNGVTGYVSSHQYFMTPFEWHQVQVEVVGQQMRLWVDGWLVADVQDWFADGRAGSIALKVGAGAVAPSEVWFDNVQVELLTTEQDLELEMSSFRQDDEAWAGDMYDTATTWSAQPSIARWGCALSSIAMVLRYYGFSFLPDGGELNPSSLNQWLRSQPDGYVADGWLNWLAVERLTRQLARDFLPGFQPIRVRQLGGVESEQLASQVVQELVSARPVIVALTHHFLVAVGTSSHRQDIRVLDPWYDSQTIGQHELADRPIQSLRLIEPYQMSERPTQTGWLLAIRDGGRPGLVDEDGQAVELEWQLWLGPERGSTATGVVDDLSGSDEQNEVATRQTADAGIQPVTSEWQVWQAVLPAKGTYFLSLSNSVSSTELRWYAYGLGDSVALRVFVAEMLENPIMVVVNDDVITSWPEHAEHAWRLVWQWWQQQEPLLMRTELEGWLRIRYLLKLIIDQGVFDQRQQQLLLKTIEYYGEAVSSERFWELERMFLDLVVNQVEPLL